MYISYKACKRQADFKCDNMPHIVLSLAIMVEMAFLNQKLTFKNIYIYLSKKKV